MQKNIEQKLKITSKRPIFINHSKKVDPFFPKTLTSKMPLKRD